MIGNGRVAWTPAERPSIYALRSRGRKGVGADIQAGRAVGLRRAAFPRTVFEVTMHPSQLRAGIEYRRCSFGIDVPLLTDKCHSPNIKPPNEPFLDEVIEWLVFGTEPLIRVVWVR